MKLKCAISVVGRRYELHVPGNRMEVDDDAVEHDAMAAHALLQAIKEFRGAPLDSSLIFPEDAINWLDRRAAEILAGWLGEDRE